jgi:hypothetical protein
MSPQSLARLVGVALLIFCAVIMASSGTYVVKPGYRGVEVTMGRVSPAFKPEGFGLKAPLITDIHQISIRQQTAEDKAECYSADLQQIAVDLKVLFRVPESSVVKLFQDFYGEPFQSLVAPRVQEALKEVAALQSAEQIVKNREQIKTRSLEIARRKLGTLSTQLDALLRWLDVRADGRDIVKLDDIRHGLRTFDTTFFQTPGRMNIFDQHGFKVILDYGHNPHALEAMCTLVDNLREGTKGKGVVVLAVPGDRRDEDAVAVAARAARSFDHFILRRDDNPRGRRDDEIPRLMEAELLRLGVSADRITVIPSEPDAVDQALKMCSKGDLLLIFGDKISRTWKQIIYFGGREPSEAPSRAVKPVVEEVALGDLSTLQGTIVRDSRGVVLVAKPMEEAD